MKIVRANIEIPKCQCGGDPELIRTINNYGSYRWAIGCAACKKITSFTAHKAPSLWKWMKIKDRKEGNFHIEPIKEPNHEG